MTEGGPGLFVLQSSQEQEWKGVLSQMARHDFYHLPEYHRLAEKRGEGIAHLFVYRDGPYTFALPLLLRSVDGSDAEAWSDATSVYGYAGPLASHADMPALVTARFQDALKKALIERRVIAVFSRLHPLIRQAATLAGLGDCQPGGETVSIDVTLPPEIQRAAYRPSTKSRLNKLRREGLVCLRDTDKCHLEEFVRIYHQTMDRVNAHSSYSFEPEYFANLASSLGAALELFVVKLDGVVICAGLFTICDGVIQYHLSGTSTDYLKLAPMTLLLDTVRLWAIDQGARVMHLGGGVGSKEDSLLHFKRGFSRNTHQFSTWRWIVDPIAYQALCERQARWNESRGLQPASRDYFPEYRAPVEASLRAAPQDGENGEQGKSVPVFAAVGHAKVVVSTIIASGLSIISFFDDDHRKWGRLAHGRHFFAPTSVGPLSTAIAISERVLPPRGVVAHGVSARNRGT
jgi:hypothetical protein